MEPQDEAKLKKSFVSANIKTRAKSVLKNVTVKTGNNSIMSIP